MKKLMMIAALMLMSVGAFEQEAGKIYLGADANMIFRDGENRFAVGAKFQYNFTENIRGEAAFKYYPKKWETTCWNLNANVQYVIPVAEKFNVYPIVGVGLFSSSYDGESTSCFVFHGGAGAEYLLSDNLKLYFDAVYQYGKKDGYAVCDNPLLSLGIAFGF